MKSRIEFLWLRISFKERREYMLHAIHCKYGDGIPIINHMNKVELVMLAC